MSLCHSRKRAQKGPQEGRQIETQGERPRDVPFAELARYYC